MFVFTITPPTVTDLDQLKTADERLFITLNAIAGLESCSGSGKFLGGFREVAHMLES